ncbi:MAG: hypothetical protein MK098_10320 [Marinovum sp.]|nr:hypothetical protein [Marinovum sp.]
MSDGKTRGQRSAAPVGVLFHNRCALIIGACHPVARLVAIGLARRGAFVVAVDEDETALLALAATNPRQIEILSVADRIEERLAQLHCAWRDQPLHYLVAAGPVDGTDSAFRRILVRHVARFAPILRQNDGRALCLFATPGATESDDPAMRGEQAAYSVVIGDLARQKKVVINGLFVHPEAPPAAAAARSIMLLSPLAAGISGALMSFHQTQTAPSD